MGCLGVDTTTTLTDKFGRRYLVEVYCGPDSLLLDVLDEHGRAAEMACSFERNDMRIDDFMVNDSREGEPPRRNRGLGTGLLGLAMEYARHRGATCVRGEVVEGDLRASPHLLAWYRSRGFRVSGEEGSGRTGTVATLFMQL